MKTHNAAAEARDLVDRLQAVSKQRSMTTPDEELVDLLWKAWSSSEGRHGRRYLMHLIRLAKRAPFEKKAKAELAQCLSDKSLRVHMPGLKAGKGARALV